jgi:predicted ArsR family transcriptional regulator
MQSILDYMKKRGEQHDSEIAAATQIPLETLRVHLEELAKRGDIIVCHSTRYVEGKPTEGMLCRVSGFIPTASPGRKPKAAAKPAD